MIKIKMSNGDKLIVDDTRRNFVEYELHYIVGNYGQATKVQVRGLHTVNTVNKGEVTINVDRISSIEDIED